MAEDMGQAIMKTVSTVMAIIFLVVVAALIIGTVLGNSIFTSIDIINITKLKEDFGGFITGFLGFIGIVGVALGIRWLVTVLKPVFSKKEGLASFSGN